jgi:hypothetical protein
MRTLKDLVTVNEIVNHCTSEKIGEHTSTSWPIRVNAMAAPRPAIPAPTIAMSKLVGEAIARERYQNAGPHGTTDVEETIGTTVAAPL